MRDVIKTVDLDSYDGESFRLDVIEEDILDSIDIDECSLDVIKRAELISFDVDRSRLDVNVAVILDSIDTVGRRLDVIKIAEVYSDEDESRLDVKWNKLDSNAIEGWKVDVIKLDGID